MAVEQLLRGADGRRVGCDERCQMLPAGHSKRYGPLTLLLHDPDAHEAYGRMLAGDRGPAIVQTGILRVDTHGWHVWIDGREERVSGNEGRLLNLLARNLGRVVEHERVHVEVWQHGYFGTRIDLVHTLRVTMSRLRGILGPRAAGLIRTVNGVGYVLDVVPVGEPRELRDRGPRLRGGRWSVAYDRCRACQTTERGHQARGYCWQRACQRRAWAEREAERGQSRD